jgi:hypothetical protein
MPQIRFARAVPWLGCLTVLACAARAEAGEFTKEGRFLFDPGAVVKLDFEEETPPEGLTTEIDEGALSGKRVLAIGAYEGPYVAVSVPKSRATYRASAWIKGAEVVGTLTLAYGANTSEVAAMYPTGRITSDGWVEVAADHVRVDGARLTALNLGFFSATGAVVDAAELVPDGGSEDLPVTANAACSGVADSGACALDQLCVWSECRNVSGWVPPIPEDRDAVADYLAARVHLLFGPYLERSVDMPAVDVELGKMRLAKDRWTYWNGFTTAIRKLHDGHTSTSGLADYVLQNPRPLALCFLEGDADVTHGTAPSDPDYLDVLVSHTGADHNLGLHTGDRLVSVDGQHPIAWARSLVSLNWSQPGISNHVTFAELAASLRGMISRYAGTIEVIRCDAAEGTCGALETISVKDIPLDPPETPVDSVSCDNRPFRHIEGAPANHQTGDEVYSGIVDASDTTEKIYGLEWESLYATSPNNGVLPPIKSAIGAWKSDARGVILDHRTGFGGTILAPEVLWGFAIPKRPGDLYVDRTFAEEEQPSPEEAKKRFDAALNTPYMQYVGSNNPVTDIPVALLITQDVSASDWLAEGLKGGPNTRIFGPFQTNGGFSTRYAFSYWLSMGYVMAVGDDILADGSTHNGRGVEPDEVVLPKQSDLLAGRDTVFEAALAWVRSGLKP